MSEQTQKKHGCNAEEWGWWEERSLPEKICIGAGFALLAVAAAFLFGWVVMLLWNWLIPDIFGLKRISYWQAWGLFILSSILFKGFGCGSSSGRHDRRRRRELRRYMREDQETAQKESSE